MLSGSGFASLSVSALPSSSSSSSSSSSFSSSSSSSYSILSRPFRVLRSQRQAHPLKEDDRLEDTQAPANGFVLLASIGIKRKPPSKLQFRFGDNDADVGGSCKPGKISGHGYIKSPVTMRRGNKYRGIFSARATVRASPTDEDGREER